jgi:hypothetical protein
MRLKWWLFAVLDSRLSVNFYQTGFFGAFGQLTVMLLAHWLDARDYR